MKEDLVKAVRKIATGSSKRCDMTLSGCREQIVRVFTQFDAVELAAAVRHLNNTEAKLADQVDVSSLEDYATRLGLIMIRQWIGDNWERICSNEPAE